MHPAQLLTHMLFLIMEILFSIFMYYLDCLIDTCYILLPTNLENV